MMRRLTIASLAAALLVALPWPSQASITVDGDLQDWGIGLLTDGSGVHFNYDAAYGYSYPGVTGPGKKGTASLSLGGGSISVRYHLEDTDDAHNNYQVGPLYGGQNYDAEFLGAVIEGSTLYLAIASGQRLDNNFCFYAPGDILVENEGTIYGIEAGGLYGMDPGTGDYALEEGDAGSSFRLHSSGRTRSRGMPANPAQLAGSVWLTDGSSTTATTGSPGSAHWRKGINGTNILTQLIGGTDTGVVADYVYRQAPQLGEHAVIELSVDLDAFGGKADYVSWAPACGNDQLSLEVDLRPNPPPVPEPASALVWSILGLCGCGFGWWRLRRFCRDERV